MGARSKARKRALDVLYEADVRGADPRATLQERLAQSDPPIAAYAVTLVEGVLAHRARIDELLSRYAVDWSLERMPPVDRNVLRLGAYEVLWSDDVPGPVAVDEAVELVRSLSTDQSPGFVNGVLGRLLQDKAELAAEERAALPPQAEVRSEGLDGAPGVDGEHAPADELLGEGVRGGVVDHSE
ncbi:MAG TPA: transcription antitermination factor NusB [Mycobacteriales bacterium]|nr:transcription antitermination factor NusB [Mycobacteriales bacterium]